MMRVLLSLIICSIASGFTATRRSSIITKTLQQTPQQIIPHYTSSSASHLSISTDDTTNESPPAVSKAPDLNGKIVLPIKIANSGLKGHTVAAVYAILDSSYKRGWVILCLWCFVLMLCCISLIILKRLYIVFVLCWYAYDIYVSLLYTKKSVSRSQCAYRYYLTPS